MMRVFLSLGSNLGDRRQHLEAALCQLETCGALRVVATSPVYETEPWPEQRVPREQWYLNCAVEIETVLPPRRLLRLMQEVETLAGRVRHPNPPGEGEPRPLDIDILLYGDRVISDHDLHIPHLFLHERRFVLAPLADIAGDFEHPTLYQSIAEILASLQDERLILPYAD
jgi:2-amino-4-hydroxy-6-hydroxymethyldihydropteridine diphosphokinase